MKIVFIINPVAGNGNALKKWSHFKNTISFPYEMVLTHFPGEATNLVKSIKESGEKALVIGFGGDGTLREIIAGAAGAEQLMIGSIAAGSGNDFGRGFCSFEDAVEIEKFLKQPITTKEDVGEFHNGETYQFVSSSGIGFDAEISFWVNRSNLKKWLNKINAGKLVYLLYVIKMLVRPKKFSLIVEHNGQRQIYEDVWLATVSNQPYFGGGMKISPNSKTDDGLLELTVVHRISRLKLLLVFGTVFTGSHTRFKEVVQKSDAEFRLTVDDSIFRHVDGDYAGETPKDETVSYAVSKKYWYAVNIRKKEEIK
ncbi:diacylglycerol/lipid kinase family protein [Planococcus sp. 1R117A]|uniref:diacylglycerol/lipid kinase family protein n=1 Tax=Planococcus sp. 1R117A TaxID=3447020 RepID=UPI003EDC49BC